jgi:outer membrane protein, heavy metal efflux system
VLRVITGPGTILVLAAVCGIFRDIPASAAEKLFTLQEAVAYSLLHNGDLKALREETGVRDAAKIKAGLYPNPLFEVEGSTGELSGSPSENRISVGITQEFLTMGKREKRLRIAEKDSEAYALRISNSTRILTGEVRMAFETVILAGMKIKLAEQADNLNHQLLDVTKQRLDAGDIPELDVNLARVESARSEGKKVEAERELYQARAKLLGLMGLPPDEEAGFIGSRPASPPVSSLADLKSRALVHRPDIRALTAEKSKSDAEITLARAEGIPDVTAGITYQRENTSVEVGGLEGKTRDNLIGLKISIPIPLFDRNQAAIREAQARQGAAESRYAFARLAVEREVEAVHERLAIANKSLQIYTRDIIPQLEENLKLVQEAYRLGEVGILSMVDELKKFVEVNDGYLSALHDRNLALIQLESAVAVDLTGGNHE